MRRGERNKDSLRREEEITHRSEEQRRASLLFDFNCSISMAESLLFDFTFYMVTVTVVKKSWAQKLKEVEEEVVVAVLWWEEGVEEVAVVVVVAVVVAG
jgi:hypothetical protein